MKNEQKIESMLRGMEIELWDEDFKSLIHENIEELRILGVVPSDRIWNILVLRRLTEIKTLLMEHQNNCKSDLNDGEENKRTR